MPEHCHVTLVGIGVQHYIDRKALASQIATGLTGGSRKLPVKCERCRGRYVVVGWRAQKLKVVYLAQIVACYRLREGQLKVIAYF